MYDFVQIAMGYPRSYARLAPLFARARVGDRVLEVGAGTGLWASLVPPAGQYIWLDLDPQKLAGFRAKYASALAIIGDASQLPVGNSAVEAVLCVGVMHHLDDDAVVGLARELARVASERVVFLDPVWVSGRPVSQLLWHYDRGSFPRTGQQLRALLAEHFEVDEIHEYAVYHRYFLCVAKPRNVQADTLGSTTG